MKVKYQGTPVRQTSHFWYCRLLLDQRTSPLPWIAPTWPWGNLPLPLTDSVNTALSVLHHRAISGGSSGDVTFLRHDDLHDRFQWHNQQSVWDQTSRIKNYPLWFNCAYTAVPPSVYVAYNGTALLYFTYAINKRALVNETMDVAI